MFQGLLGLLTGRAAPGPLHQRGGAALQHLPAVAPGLSKSAWVSSHCSVTRCAVSRSRTFSVTDLRSNSQLPSTAEGTARVCIPSPDHRASLPAQKHPCGRAPQRGPTHRPSALPRCIQDARKQPTSEKTLTVPLPIPVAVEDQVWAPRVLGGRPGGRRAQALGVAFGLHLGQQRVLERILAEAPPPSRHRPPDPLPFWFRRSARPHRGHEKDQLAAPTASRSAPATRTCFDSEKSQGLSGSW